MQTSQQPAGKSAAAPEYSSMASVLIVDDEPLIRWSLGETLEAAGHSVREAGSAADALRFFEPGAEPIGAVVLDLKLPDSSDLGLLRRIRQLAPACRIILITAHGTPEVLEEARKSGVSGVLTKPFDMSCVVPLVDDSARA